jgi:hypothetical protein
MFYFAVCDSVEIQNPCEVIKYYVSGDTLDEKQTGRKNYQLAVLTIHWPISPTIRVV